MKKTAVTLAIMAVLGTMTYAQDTANVPNDKTAAAPSDKPAAQVTQDGLKMPPIGQRVKPETIEAKVLKVYSAEDDGAKFKAYVVKWKDSEIVVTDPMGTSDKKEGDTIKVMVMRMEIPGRGKMIRFMLAEGFPGMPGMKKPEPNEIPMKAPEAPKAKPDADTGK